MTPFKILSLNILLGILTATVLGAQSPAKVLGISDAGKAALNAQLKDSVARGDTMGVNALVVNRDGVIFEGAAGIPANSIFNIASMTKPVTSVAIMMLMEQGKLKLDDPVSKYLDGYDKLQVISKFNEKDGTYETRPAKRAMTIRHLLSHTSGIGYTHVERRRAEDPGDDEEERVGAAAAQRSRRRVALQRQHPRPRLHRRDGDRRRRSRTGTTSTSSRRSA